MKLTLAQWILRLTRGYKKATGKEPDGLAKLKIKMEAGQKVKDQEKVIDITSRIKDEWGKAKSTPKEGGITTVHHLRDPLKKYRDRIEPGSLLEDQARRDPTEAYRSIVWYEFNDARIKALSTGRIEDVNSRINYKKMEDILETKLKGNETWDDLAAIRDRKFPMPEDKASGGRIGFAEGKTYKDWLNYRIKEIAAQRLPTPFKEWKKGEIKMASGGIAGELHLNRQGYESGREVLPQQEIYEEELEKRGGFTGDPLYYFLGPGIETLKYKWPRSLLKKMIDDYKDIPEERLPENFGPGLGSGVNVDIPLRKYRKKKLSPMIRRKKRKTIEQEAAKGGLAKVLGV